MRKIGIFQVRIKDEKIWELVKNMIPKEKHELIEKGLGIISARASCNSPSSTSTKNNFNPPHSSIPAHATQVDTFVADAKTKLDDFSKRITAQEVKLSDFEERVKSTTERIDAYLSKLDVQLRKLEERVKTLEKQMALVPKEPFWVQVKRALGI